MVGAVIGPVRWWRARCRDDALSDRIALAFEESARSVGICELVEATEAQRLVGSVSQYTCAPAMIPTEPIGSIPRPPALIEAIQQSDNDDPRLDPMFWRRSRTSCARRSTRSSAGRRCCSARHATKPTSRKGLEAIERNARVQAQLIEDLLDMSRIISGKLRLDVQPVDLADVIEAAVETGAARGRGQGASRSRAARSRAPARCGDPARLQQVVWNLLSNAIKFTPQGGQRPGRARARRTPTSRSASPTPARASRPEFLPHVFERFRQADASTTRRTAGSAWVCRSSSSLVELHGGTRPRKSPGEGLGTTFTVRLPLAVVHRRASTARAASASAAGADADVPSPRTSPALKVLVVDDEPDARELIRRVLEECGAEVLAAASRRRGARL